jgi:dolichyl-phosphate beta-glucosyltransferase
MSITDRSLGRTVPGSSPHAMASVGIVIPCFNEAHRLPVATIRDDLVRNPQLTLCFVDDGSTDGTLALLKALSATAEGRCRTLALQTNQGKAEAVRRGVLELCSDADLEYIGFWDADMSTPLSELRLFLQAFRECPERRFAVGSRIRRLGATINRKLWRHFLGRIAATLISNWLRLPVYDTQCGAKLFEPSLARTLFEKPFISRWLFDVELFQRCVDCVGQENAAAVIVEVPLTFWSERAGSKISLATYVSASLDFVRIASTRA